MNRNLNIVITTLVIVISTLLIIHSLFHFTILPINEPIQPKETQEVEKIENNAHDN